MASSKWTIIYYETIEGVEVVESEMKSFGPKIFARILRTVDMLEEFGLELAGDYVKHVREKIWELRVSKYRVLYFAFAGKRFILLRAFMKTTDKTPRGEIKIAEERMEDYLGRFEEVKILK